ncbi:MAG: hypothetical protein GY855_15825 [candidate division Zixibacteria bacterium]|nr:hypothetical protein [candidate division Zixibacteria bacterium]
MGFLESFLGSIAAKYTIDLIKDVLNDMSNDEGSGQLIFFKGRFQKVTSKFNIKKGKNIKLLEERIKQSDRLFKYYANEESLLASGEDIRICYAHQLSFIPGSENYTDINNIHAQLAEDYDIDNILNINGYKDAAIKFRINRGSIEPYEGSTVRLQSWESKTKFQISKSFYKDQFVTNQKEIVDIPLKDILLDTTLEIPPRIREKSFRSLNAVDGKLKEFQDSILSNTVGSAATVITSDGFLILPKRNKSVHFQSGYEGCSVSGVAEWTEALLTDFILELQNQLVNKEGPQELLLIPKKITVHPLAFSRELERAGKPQFFFHIWTNQSLSDFMSKWKISPFPSQEYDSIRWIQLYKPSNLNTPDKTITQIIDRIGALINKDTIIKTQDGRPIVLSDEVRANLFYLMAFLFYTRKDAFPKEWLS